MKSILRYGQAIKVAKRAKTVKGASTIQASVTIVSSAGDALRDGYKLKGYVKVNNGVFSYWRKDTSK